MMNHGATRHATIGQIEKQWLLGVEKTSTSRPNEATESFTQRRSLKGMTGMLLTSSRK